MKKELIELRVNEAPKMRCYSPFLVLCLALTACGDGSSMSTPSTLAPSTVVLVFSKTTGFRHDSIASGIAAIRRLGAENQFAVDTSEDAASFNDANLSRYKAIIFLNTTGDLFNDDQRAALQRYIRAGGGFVGIHSASDTERGWSWYGGLVGAFVQDHPAIQTATIIVEDRVHPSTSQLPANWERSDEWYNFANNPRARVHVLMKLDESTYSGGTMSGDHPISWCQLFEGGRSWYTGGGHTQQSYSEELFLQHVLGGVRYAMGIANGDCSVN